MYAFYNFNPKQSLNVKQSLTPEGWPLKNFVTPNCLVFICVNTVRFRTVRQLEVSMP